MFDNRNPWNVQYNARSNRSHPPTSPNIAPTPKNESNACSSLRMKRHLHCAEQQRSPSNITKYCTCHEKKFPEHSWNVIFYNAGTIWPWSQNDPRMIRAWNRQSATRLATEVTFRARHEHFLLKNTTFRAPAIIPNFTKCCTCHEKWQLNFTKYCGCHEKWHHQIVHVPRKVTVELHQIMHLPQKVTLELHQKSAPATKSDTWTSTILWLYFSLLCYSLILYWSITWLNYCLTELVLDWTITWLLQYLTKLVLDWTLFYYSLTLLFSYSSILLFYDSLLYYSLTLLFFTLPVVPHKAVAEASKIGNL